MCGRLHYPDGNAVFSRKGQEVYYKQWEYQKKGYFVYQNPCSLDNFLDDDDRPTSAE